jgi:hypothetical protein
LISDSMMKGEFMKSRVPIDVDPCVILGIALEKLLDRFESRVKEQADKLLP